MSSKISIFINPGHAPNGDPDPGAVNEEYGIQEAIVVRTIGDELVDYLTDAGFNIVFCQDDNLDEGEDSVVGQANASGCDYFVSIHANSAESDVAQGTETFYFDGSEEGKALAASVQWQIVHTMGTVDRGIKTARFAVLRETDMPAILIETAFISNEEDAELLADNAALKEMAKAIGRGIVDYIVYNVQ